MALEDLIRKKQASWWWQQDDQQTGGDDWAYTPAPSWLQQMVLWAQSGWWDNFSASKSLEDSLNWVEKNTALSGWQLKEYRDDAVDFFDNARHTITDKDEEHGIKDYSQYKMYKDALDNARPWTDLSPIYEQMAKEWVIDYDKFAKWQTEEYQPNKFDKFDKTVETIKENFDKRLSNSLSQFMRWVDWSYQLNAVTKARQEMYDQYEMFIDSYAQTYKSTRDPKLLENFDKTLRDYENSIIQFTTQFCYNLTTKNESWITAYYDTLNDANMKDYAKWIRQIQWDAENKMAAAAIKSNFWDSREALKSWNIISSVAEIIWWGMNTVNYLLDKVVWDPTEYAKNTALWWYDVLEELANLNVYSNDAGYLEKTFWTMASYAWEIVDAAPTLVPMVVDLVIWSKAWVMSKVGDWNDIIKPARYIDDAIWKIFKNKNNLRNVAKAWDVILNEEYAANLWRFWIKYLSEALQNIFVFDIAFQQFENRPLTDNDLLTNFLFNVPIDTIVAMFPQVPKILAKWLDKTIDLNSPKLDKDVYEMLVKHFNANKEVIEAWMKEWASEEAKAASERAIKQAQEKYYMAMSRNVRTWKKATSIVDIATDWIESNVSNFIKQVQEWSSDVYDRLTTFWGNLDDYLLEMESRLPKKLAQSLPYSDQIELYWKDFVAKSDYVKAINAQAKTQMNISLLTKVSREIWWDKMVNTAIDKALWWDSLVGNALKATFWTDKGQYMEAVKALEESWEDVSRDTIAASVDKVMSALIEDNPNLIDKWEVVSGWIKQADWNYKNAFTEEMITFAELVDRLKWRLWANVVQSTVLSDSLTDLLSKIDWWTLPKITKDNLSWQAPKPTEYYDITSTLQQIWWWSIFWFNKTWNGREWNNLLKYDPTAIFVNETYKNLWIRIAGNEDGSFTIQATREAIQDLRNWINDMAKIQPDSQITSKNLNILKFMYANEYSQEIDWAVKAVNARRTEAWLPQLTQEEKKVFSDWHQHFIDKVYEVKKVDEKKLNEMKARRNINTKNKADEERINKSLDTKQQINKWDTVLTSTVDEEWTKNINEKISEVVNWEASVKELEQTAATELNNQKLKEETNVMNKTLSQLLNYENIIRMAEERASWAERLEKAFKNLFKWTWVDDELAWEISKKFASIASNMLAWLDWDSADVLQRQLAKALWAIQVSPMTASMLIKQTETGWEDTGLIKNLLAASLSQDSKSIYAFAASLKKLSESLVWKSNVWDVQLKKALNDFANVKALMNVNDVKNNRSAIENQVGKMIDILTTDDYNKWFKRIIDLYKKYKLSDIDWKNINLKKISDAISEMFGWEPTVLSLSQKNIDAIADVLAPAYLYQLWIYSESLHNKIRTSIANWLDAIWKKAIETNTDIKLRFDLSDSMAFNHEWTLDIWAMWMPWVLASLSSEAIFENALVHEYNHYLWSVPNKSEARKLLDDAINNIKNTDERLEQKAFAEAEWDLSELWWRYVDYISNLRKRFENALKKSNNTADDQDLWMYMDEYFFKWDPNVLLERINKDLSKKQVLNSLIDRYFGEERQWLNNIFSAMRFYDPGAEHNIIEEYITQLETRAELGKLDIWWLSKVIDLPLLNRTLQNLQQCAEMIDRFRYIAAKNNEWSAEALRNALSRAYDLSSAIKYKNNADTVANILYSTAKESWDAEASVRGMKKAFWITTEKMWDLVSWDVATFKKKALETLSSIIDNEKELADIWLSKEQVKSLINAVNKWSDEDLLLMLSYLDSYQYIPREQFVWRFKEPWRSWQIDAHYYETSDNILSRQLDAVMGKEHLDEHGNRIVAWTTQHSMVDETLNQWVITSPESWVVEKSIKSLKDVEMVTKSALDLIDGFKQNDEVPVIKTLSSMWYDVGIYWKDALDVLTQLVWDVSKEINKNKLFVGQDTIDVFNEYVKAKQAVDPTFKWDFWLFVTNKVIANVLSTEWKYSEETVAVINNLLKDSQYDTVVNSLTSAEGKYNKDNFVKLFNLVKDEFVFQKWYWKKILVDNPNAPEFLTKEEWQEAYNLWKDTWAETMDKHYMFDRQWTIKVNKKTKSFDLWTYEWYKAYYDTINYVKDGKPRMYQYTQYKNADVDIEKVLNNIHPDEIAKFNQKFANYIEASKFGSAEQELSSLQREFVNIMEWIQNPNRADFRITIWWSIPEKPKKKVTKDHRKAEVKKQLAKVKEAPEVKDRQWTDEDLDTILKIRDTFPWKEWDAMVAVYAREKYWTALTDDEIFDMFNKVDDANVLSDEVTFSELEAKEEVENKIAKMWSTAAEEDATEIDVMNDELEQATDMFWWDVNSQYLSDWKQTLRDKVENLIPWMANDMLSKQQIEYDIDKYVFDENHVDNRFTANLGIKYNSLENPEDAKWLIQDRLNLVKDDEWLDLADERYTVWWRLQSYVNWSYEEWSLLKSATAHWVHSLFGKTIRGKEIRNVQVSFRNGESMIFSAMPEWVKADRTIWEYAIEDWKTLVKYSMWTSTDDLLDSLTFSLLSKWGWVNVRYLDENMEQLEKVYVKANDMWKSYIGKQILDQLGLINYNVEDLTSTELYKLYWLVWWDGKKIRYKDIYNLAYSMWDMWVGYNNQSAFENLSQYTQTKIENNQVSLYYLTKQQDEINKQINLLERTNKQRAKATQTVNVKNAIAKEEENIKELKAQKEQLQKDYDELAARWQILRATKQKMDSRMIDLWYSTSKEKNDIIVKLNSLTIDAIPKFYNADWTPFKHMEQAGKSNETHVKHIHQYADWTTKVEYPKRFEMKEQPDWSYKMVENSNQRIIYGADRKEEKREPLSHKYRAIGIKPRITVYDTTKELADAQNRVDASDIVQDLIPNGELVQSYYLNWSKKWWFIPLDKSTNLDSEAFWENVDNKIMEEIMWETNWLTAKVDRQWPIIVQFVDDDWDMFDAMLEPTTQMIWSKPIPAYYLWFNNDAKIWEAMQNGKGYDFYKWLPWEFAKKPTKWEWKEVEKKVLTEAEQKVKDERLKKLVELDKHMLDSMEDFNKYMAARADLPKEEKMDFYRLLRNSYEDEKKDIAKRLAAAREHWDLSENAEYQAAIDDRKLLDAKIKDIDTLMYKLSNTTNGPQLLWSNEFVNWDRLLVYENRIPLSYSEWRYLWSKAEWVEPTGWKDNREMYAIYKDPETGDDVIEWWVIMDDEKYASIENKVLKLESDEYARVLEKIKAGDDVNHVKTPVKELKPSKDNLSELLDENYSDSVKNLLDEKEATEYNQTFINESAKENADNKNIAKQIKKINHYDMSNKITESSKLTNDYFAVSNFDVLGWSSLISQIIWENNNFKRVYWEELKNAVKRFDDNFGALDEEAQENFFKQVRNAVWEAKSKWENVYEIFSDPQNEAEMAMNSIAGIFNRAGWHNTSILDKFHNANSADAMLQKTFASYNNAALWRFEQLKDTDDVRNFIKEESIRMWASEKRATNIAKDFVWDPLGTWMAFRFLANIRSAYRFAKYSLLSPISWSLMYLNSLVMSEPLLYGKRQGLGLYYNSPAFKKLMNEEWVTNWLEREEDLIFQWANWLQVNWLVVDQAIEKFANILGKPFWEATRKKIRAAALWGIHSVYDMQRSGSVREYAFAQALKQNGVETEQALTDLLRKVQDKSINGEEYITKWRSIMQNTEENYARFFSNANTTSMSRHRWSRAMWFNFLQGYVINRVDEMIQWVRKLARFIDEKWAKNITWDDLTDHLAKDNIEMKSFMNNVLLTAKIWYYLDKVDDADWEEADNLKEYFINSNDYLSSLDASWFYRIFKAPFTWVQNYLEYSEFAKQDPTVMWWVSNAAWKTASEVCSQFFREWKFLSAIANTLVAAMQTWDLDFASTVAWVEWEKMANWLWRFWLVEWLEKYWLEDYSESSDIIWQVLMSSNKTSTSGKIQDKMRAMSNVDSVINDPSYAAVTAIWYLPLIWEMVKAATGNGWYWFTEAKYRELMHMVETDDNLKTLYKGELDTWVYSDEAINRIWNDFLAFNYPQKYEKSPGIHSVWSYSQWKDITLNSMKEDVFVQNICEKLWMSLEDLHSYITADWTNNAKKAGQLKVMAAAEAAEPGSWHILLSYIMSNALYQLEKEYTGNNYPSTADIWDEAMNQLKRIVLEQYWDMMFTADKTSWYKTIREYVSEANPEVFKTLYKNDQLNSYVWSVGFMDMLMRDAAQKWDVDAKYIKNMFWVLTKYMKDPTARTTAVEYLFNQADRLDMPESTRKMTMEWILAGNIDFYNYLKNSPVLSTVYADALDSFEHRIRWTLDLDIPDESYRKQGYSKKYTPYASQYGQRNWDLEDDLKDKANTFFPKSSWNGSRPWFIPTYSYTPSWWRRRTPLDFKRNYYEELIKDFSEKLVKSEAKTYPAEYNNTFLSREENIWSIRARQLEFPQHKRKQYSTRVLSNLPWSSG